MSRTTNGAWLPSGNFYELGIDGEMVLFSEEGELLARVPTVDPIRMAEAVLAYAERRHQQGIELGNAARARDLRRLLEVGEFAAEVTHG